MFNRPLKWISRGGWIADLPGRFPPAGPEMLIRFGRNGFDSILFRLR
jgi:hypothetical protein